MSTTPRQEPDLSSTKEAGKKKGKRATKASSSDPSVGKYEIFEVLKDAVNGHAAGPKYPAIDKRFYIYEPEPGKRQTLLATPEGEVSIVADKAVKTAMMIHHQNYSNGLLAKDAHEAQQQWLWGTEHVPEIKLIAFADETALAWRKIPFVPRPGEFPTFKEMFSRMTNADAAMAYIGSLLVPTSDRQQYWWLQGDGQDGKGALGRFLVELMGKASQSMSNSPDAADKFIGSPFVGKRLVICHDLEKDSKIVSSGFFKSVTGGDSVFIQYKGKDGYSVKLQCKFVLMSNYMPVIGDNRADLRRIVLSTIAKFNGEPIGEEDYNALLWAEGPHFIHACLLRYFQSCPGNGAIKADTAEVMEVIAERHAAEEAFFERWFKLEEGCVMDSASMENAMRACYPHDPRKAKALREWIVGAHGLKTGRYRDPDREDLDASGRPKQRRCIFGLGFNAAGLAMGF